MQSFKVGDVILAKANVMGITGVHLFECYDAFDNFSQFKSCDRINECGIEGRYWGSIYRSGGGNIEFVGYTKHVTFNNLYQKLL